MLKLKFSIDCLFCFVWFVEKADNLPHCSGSYDCGVFISHHGDDCAVFIGPTSAQIIPFCYTCSGGLFVPFYSYDCQKSYKVQKQLVYQGVNSRKKCVRKTDINHEYGTDMKHWSYASNEESKCSNILRERDTNKHKNKILSNRIKLY